MDLDKFKYYLIIDVEANCPEKDSVTLEDMEMVEIGAVMVCANTLEKVSEFNTLIKPVKSKLTPFFTQLTTITENDLKDAPSYPEAFKAFTHWLDNFTDYLFCSWGNYDKQQFEQDSAVHNLPYPIPAPHLNIKKQFSKAQRVRKRQGMAGALKLAQIPIEGTHHRGIDDANNMVKLMPYVLGRKFIPSYQPAQAK
ncbi:3'-5' exonuclease [uncultured Pseudoalteromonas sp.]|jgi:inhibitor of KinA sporulation pathway (predicted exonuclease)|uniref:3'-5' exonuclease n=1 Tax=Pseudoalteromonas tetraodonis TaxID=43659 RepID=UPI0032B1E806